MKRWWRSSGRVDQDSEDLGTKLHLSKDIQLQLYTSQECYTYMQDAWKGLKKIQNQDFDLRRQHLIERADYMAATSNLSQEHAIKQIRNGSNKKETLLQYIPLMQNENKT